MQIDIRDNKNYLRKNFLKKRSELSSTNRELKSRKIMNTLIGIDEIKNAKNICIYVSKDSEADTKIIIEWLLGIGKAVYVPKSDIKSSKMTFYKIYSLDELCIGAFNVLEPKGDNEKYSYSDSNDVCIVPAISFDKSGYRLGYGKGYYDRFLTGFKGVKIGICFDEFISETLPRLDTDIAVDMIITDVKKYCVKVES